MNGKTTWTLPYKKKSDEYNNPFYDKMTITNLVDVIYAVHAECKFLSAFTHIKQHGSKTQHDIQAIIACLIANATSLGTYKMGDSSDIPYTILRTVDKNYIRLETLKAANDYISNKFSQLPIYHATIWAVSLMAQVMGKNIKHVGTPSIPDILTTTRFCKVLKPFVTESS